ncbi:hypothetical protein A1Q1_03356 [Trichosporon asahii var. asahii CBS 2479]|uniref:Uncharacterized protein n=1 Tax=Trichosporon asahii var. asahii (strain ATCC 90039 / CBS 2479 / JCM 2466 / KCTC 7840 / NBRC 103889/ NCYC 2677 / UAMH 7654) TaxID=1186058 RepID=J5SVM9_TRIAS|nr:hypothetical protein A1Q1_03356 [Trichosporon asahii var. asahii CBS 2479]EJT47781.1 hypothetical protein A1Q1_03356 [Trichosporon asahii var. asahii CBS 2479]
MSNAHRPTWNPKQGQDSKMGTAQVSKHGMASHTKLKFRQVGQTSVSDVARRDLRAELAAAERAAQDKKRKAQGLPPLPPLPPVGGAKEIGNGEGEKVDEEDEAAAKRRKILEEAAELDRDDSSDEDEDEDDDDDDDDE